MEEFLNYTQVVSLLKEQMDYINTPKTNDDIKQTIKLMFDTSYGEHSPT
jgi:hypothetical protein